MVRFFSLIFILITFYWVSLIKSNSRTKIINNTLEATFDIPGASTETKNNLRFKTIVDRYIAFLLEIYCYSCDKVDPVL